MTWYYNDRPYEPTEEELNSLVGFVYLIEEADTGMKYIGKKGSSGVVRSYPSPKHARDARRRS